MNIILFDGPEREDLLPFTYTRPTGAIRCGIMTPAERWAHISGNEVSFLTQQYLSKKFPHIQKEYNYLISGCIIPDNVLIEEIKKLEPGQALFLNGYEAAFLWDTKDGEAFAGNAVAQSWKRIDSASTGALHLTKPWHIFSLNDQAIRLDFQLLTAGRKSQACDDTNRMISPENIFIEAGAKVQGAFLNASTGPIYIGKETEVMEGTIIRGPFALCEHAATKMATKIYGATTIGPHCKVGGEVSNIVMFGYSNKGHDGFLGNAVVGEWCNLGADTNSSNLKNNYAEVKLWSHKNQKFEKTGLTFCGLMMADHAKCGINTMFNTATVVGVAANIFGAGFPRTFIPAFSWGGAQGFETFQLPKVYEMATAMAGRRNILFDDTEKEIMDEVYKLTSEQRFWEKTNV